MPACAGVPSRRTRLLSVSSVTSKDASCAAATPDTPTEAMTSAMAAAATRRVRSAVPVMLWPSRLEETPNAHSASRAGEAR
jgi:hypothetical protein